MLAEEGNIFLTLLPCILHCLYYNILIDTIMIALKHILFYSLHYNVWKLPSILWTKSIRFFFKLHKLKKKKKRGHSAFSCCGSLSPLRRSCYLSLPLCLSALVTPYLFDHSHSNLSHRKNNKNSLPFFSHTAHISISFLERKEISFINKFTTKSVTYKWCFYLLLSQPFFQLVWFGQNMHRN